MLETLVAHFRIHGYRYRIINLTADRSECQGYIDLVVIERGDSRYKMTHLGFAFRFSGPNELPTIVDHVLHRTLPTDARDPQHGFAVRSLR